MEIMRLFMTPDEGLYDKKITDFFDDEVLNSNFWMYWRTMFAFENWHSALEMKRYLQRYIHHIGGLPDFTALRFTRYNQYESMILPMVKYLEGFGVQFHYDTKVTNIAFDCAGSKKQATRIDILHDGQESSIDLTENDLVFITNGGCVENSTLGSQDTPAEFKPEIKEGGGWDLWRKIAAQDPSFGHPDKFCYDPELSNWMSATVTTLDHLQARPVQRQGRHRRHCHGHRLQLAAELDAEPSAAVPRPAQGSALRLGLQPVHRQARQLYQEAHARLHRQGDLHGVAVPPGRARGSDRGHGREQRQHRALHDAVY